MLVFFFLFLSQWFLRCFLACEFIITRYDIGRDLRRNNVKKFWYCFETSWKNIWKTCIFLSVVLSTWLNINIIKTKQFRVLIKTDFRDIIFIVWPVLWTTWFHLFTLLIYIWLIKKSYDFMSYLVKGTGKI